MNVSSYYWCFVKSSHLNIDTSVCSISNYQSWNDLHEVVIVLSDNICACLVFLICNDVTKISLFWFCVCLQCTIIMVGDGHSFICKTVNETLNGSHGGLVSFGCPGSSFLFYS